MVLAGTENTRIGNITEGKEKGVYEKIEKKTWVKRIIILSIVLSSLISLNSIENIKDEISIINNYYQWTKIGGILEIMTYIIVIIWIRKEWGIEKLFSAFGIIMLLYVNDYISFFITLECQVLILYILASRDSVSSGLKYFVIGSLSSAIIILGIALIYSKTGITDIKIINNITGVEEIEWGKKLIILGVLVKIGVPPFHIWNIDIMDNSKTDITAWFGTISKLSVIYVLRLWSPEVINYGIFIILCVVIGTMMGLIQNKVKRLLAYSGVVQTGFILLGIKSLMENNTELGIYNIAYQSWIFYIIQYFISLTVILLIVNQIKAIYLHDLKVNVFIMILLIVHLLSLAGFPPFLGFLGKFLILQNTLTHSFLICFIAIIASVFSFFIYFNVISSIVISDSIFIKNTADAWIISYATILTLYFVYSGLPIGLFI